MAKLDLVGYWIFLLLQRANVCSVQAASMGELLLRPALRRAKLSDSLADLLKVLLIIRRCYNKLPRAYYQ
jgi:hypothetical protein